MSDQPAPGVRLGLPPAGPGSVASLGRRFGQVLLDIVVGALIAGLVTASVSDPTPLVRNLAAEGAFLVAVALLVALTGQSVGMRLVGIRVVRLADGTKPGLLRAVVRTLLVLLVVPPLLLDRDSRGLHDRLTGTVVLEA